MAEAVTQSHGNYAPIKPEYIVPKSVKTEPLPAEEHGVDAEKSNADSVALDGRAAPPKREKGMNKNRKRATQAGQNASLLLCSSGMKTFCGLMFFFCSDQ
jgi:hypothetical protein